MDWINLIQSTLVPIIIAGGTGYFGYIFGSKRTREQVDNDRIKNIDEIIDRLKEENKRAHDRIDDLQKEVGLLVDSGKLKRISINEGYKCEYFIQNGVCPVIQKQNENKEK